ncbi:LysR substrate-binding domain-containing protein [Glaciimonas sp. CA11.2]|nr:LysR substrate-binding domain-containing protein [Glaciimonas sp. Gout2]MEB0013979.1 LysR substrate-binding domain-containing protein [Glaciimonas sp. Cout2]MEB0161716.1 LysR substrate-binding domain-containing protein [Glaciimonas sp. CA11.2]
MLKYLDLTLLQAFAAVVDSGSFTRAARYLCRTQSAVSMQLRKLEELIGKQVLQRDNRHIRLTEEGEVLLGYARRMIRLNDEALAALGQPFAEGHVRLGMPDDYAQFFLPAVLTSFAHAYPRVQLEVIGALSGELLDKIEAGDLDVALITRQSNRSCGQILRREQLVWAGSRQHLVHDEAPVPLALFPEGCVFREHALAALDAHGRPWRVAYSSQSFAGGKIAVSGGLAVTVMAQSMVPVEWRTFGLEENFPPLPEVEIVLHRAPGTLPTATALLEEQLIKSVRTEFCGAAPETSDAVCHLP